jgi:signal transduction histidine kinase
MSRVRDFAVAIAATLVAAVLTKILDAVLGAPEELLFAAAVAVSAWYGGRIAGVLASAFSVLTLDYFVVPPVGTLELDPQKAMYLIAFAAVALVISYTSEALRQARALAEQRAKELQVLNDEERQARGRAETLAKTREEVLGVVAHDLRNPLNLVGSTAALLLEPELPPAKRDELLGVLRRSVQQMNRLIQDLLDATRIAAGRLSMDFREVAVGELLHQTESMFRDAAQRRHLSLDIDPDGAMQVRADPDRVQQVLGNLLSNAVKFTPERGTIRVSAHGTEGDVVFEVHNSGPAIAPEELAHLFERYWQARNADRRGIGLGLTISKGIVDAHGGRIWVESRPESGTTFRFTLPRSKYESKS